MNDARSPAEATRNETAAVTQVDTLFCVNAGFLQHAAVCMASLLANNPDLFFNIVVVSQPVEVLDEGKLQRSLTQFPNHVLSFRKFTIPRNLVLPLNPLAHYTLDTYTRLWVSAFFPAKTKRVFYLDADIVVVGSIKPLWTTDLAGALMGAVDIPGSDRGVQRLAMRAEDGYFNAGVLIIDLDQWRTTNAAEEALGYVRDNPDRVLYDQDALNACFYARTKRLDYIWNVIRPFYRDPPILPLERKESERIRHEARIIHFNGSSKPWSYFCDHPRKTEYQTYLRMTEWRDYVPPDRTPLNRLRKALSVILPAPVKTRLKAAATEIAGRRRPVGA